MSRQAILVPDIGSDSADVIEILIRPDDRVEAGQSIIVLESAKASMEVPCPQAGRVAEIATQVGQTVKQGDVILWLDSGAAALDVPVAHIAEELRQVSLVLTSPGQEPTASSLADAANMSSSASTTLLRTVKVPDIGSESADVIEILVAVGDVIAREQSLVVLESAKASMEVPSTQAGVVQKIHVNVGDKVFEHTPLLDVQVTAAASEADSTTTAITTAIMADGGVSSSASAELSSENIASEITSKNNASKNNILKGSEPSKSGLDNDVYKNSASETTISIANNSNNASNIKGSNTISRTNSERGVNDASNSHNDGGYEGYTHGSRGVIVHAGPAVRRLARELGVDLARVTPSGPRDRILKNDVQTYVKQRLSQMAATPAAPATPALPVIDFGKWGEIERLPLSKIQRLSAGNLHRAWVTIPHVTQFDEADITELESFRCAQKEAFKAEGLSLTLLSFLVKASAHVLRQYPKFASSLEGDGEHIIWKKYLHIGVAVDTPNGLQVPVIRDVDRKSIRDITRDLGDLSARARDKKLTPAEMQGACFSISSLGGIGGTAFTPIVNWPEVAILGVSRSALKPVWDGRAFQPRLMLPLSLSYDHRVIDGADAARFTTALTQVLGDIRQLLL